MIPTYNQVDYVAETLESVLNQTYTNLEVVVADDGSTDGTANTVREYAARDSRIKPLLSAENVGISRNFNRGFDACTGDYVAFFGGDDVMLPTKLEKQVRFLEAHPEYVYCQHDTEIFDSSSGRRLYRHGEEGRIPDNALDWAFPTDWFFLKKYTSVLVSAGLARSDYYLNARYSEKLRYKHEILFFVENHCANPKGKWHTLPEVLARYRVHGANFSMQEENKRLIGKENQAVIEHTKKYYPAIKKRAEEYERFLLFKAFVYGYHKNFEQEAINQKLLKQGNIFFMYARFCKWLLKKNLLFLLTKPLRLKKHFDIQVFLFKGRYYSS